MTLTNEKTVIVQEKHQQSDMRRVMDTARAESYGFKPKTSFEEGIRKTIKWYLENVSVEVNA